MLSPNEGTSTSTRKRLCKNNLSEANILNVIDEEELQRRVANVCLSLLLKCWNNPCFICFAKVEDDFLVENEENEEASNKPNNVKSDEKLPELFEGGTMRPYQIDGFHWLVVRICLSTIIEAQ